MDIVTRANNSKCPCKGCFVRKLGCHGFCVKYQEWKEKMDVRREEDRQWRNTSNAVISGLMHITQRKRT